MRFWPCVSAVPPATPTNRTTGSAIPCIDDASIAVTLLVKRVASPADEEFIGFELNNKTGGPLTIGGGHYTITATISPRDESNAGDNGRRAWGDNPGFWNEKIPPGITRRLQFCSDQCLAQLGIPTASNTAAEGQLVALQLNVEGKAIGLVYREGLSFHLDWLPPDERGIAALRQRLKRLLLTPDGPTDTSLATLLARDDIASAVTSADLVAGLRRRGQAWGRVVINHIDKTCPTDELVIAFWLETIKFPWGGLLNDLSEAQHVRDTRLIEPLRQLIGKDQWPFCFTEAALRILVHQRGLMADSKAVAADLGRTMLARTPMIRKGEFSLSVQHAMPWSREVMMLAMTGDPTLAKFMVPYLDYKDIVFDASRIAAANDGVSTRACDLAYNAILDLLDRPGERFTIQFGLKPGPRPPAREVHARRDEMISRLKAEFVP